MRKNLSPWLFWVTIALCAVALLSSASMLVDYVRPAPVFCGNGGCGAIKRTIFAYPFGIPMPVFGISGLLAIAVTAMVPGRRARIAQVTLAALGGIVATGLIGVQIAMKTVCPYCAVVDGVSLVLVGLSIVRVLRASDPPSHKAFTLGGAMGVSLAIAGPIGVGMNKKPLPEAVPDVIAEELRKTPRGMITVVDFADFECPYCRSTHAELAPLVAERKGKVRVARKHVPLRMHEHAADAARAACCAEAMGKGEVMADALFSAERSALSPEGCEQLAKDAGLDLEKFRACLSDAKTEARIREDGEMFRAAHGVGLPTLWIGTRKLEGSQDAETLRAALDAAIREL